MARFGTVEVDVVVDVKHEIVLGTTPDGNAEVWLLYTPEPYPHGGHEDRAIHLWVRRCSVHTSRVEAIAHLDNLLGHQVPWRKYDPLFPELWIGEDHRGKRWLMEPAPVNPFPGEQP